MIRTNHIEVFNLETGAFASVQAITPFSSHRNVLHKMQPAIETIEQCFRDLGVRLHFFIPKCNIVIHQLEGIEGGLSQIEIRGLRDLAESVGGSNVVVQEGDYLISHEEALQLLKENK